MNKILNTIIWVTIGFFAGLLVFKSCGKDAEAPVIIPPAQIKKEAAKEALPYQKKYDSVVVLLKQYQNKTEAIKKDLVNARASKAMAEKELNFIINELPDSLKNNVAEKANDYEWYSKYSDTLCDRAIAAQEARLALKDSLIKFKDTLYNKLYGKFDFCLDQQGLLLKYNGQLQKKIQHKKAGVLVWKIATAVTAALLIKQSLK